MRVVRSGWRSLCRSPGVAAGDVSARKPVPSTASASILGEWELTATVTQQTGSGGSLWTGALSLKHVGFCSVDGPEEKTGTVQLHVSDPPGEVVATLLIEGVECAFKGHGTDGYGGVITCPGQRDEPMMLILRNRPRTSAATIPTAGDHRSGHLVFYH